MNTGDPISNLPVKTKTCNTCRQVKPLSEFYKDRSKPDGYKYFCNVCKKEKNKIWMRKMRAKRPPRICDICGEPFGRGKKFCGKCRESNRYEQHRSDIGRKYKDNLKVNGCCVCGYRSCSHALEFHHIGKRKDLKISETINIGSIKREIEDKAIVVLCANCHREVHAKLIDENSLLPYRLNVSNNQSKLFYLRQANG